MTNDQVPNPKEFPITKCPINRRAAVLVASLRVFGVKRSLPGHCRTSKTTITVLGLRLG